MSELEDKLNTILGDPQAMGQIMALAQSLGGGKERHQPETPPPPEYGDEPPRTTQNRPLHRTCPPCWVP